MASLALMNMSSTEPTKPHHGSSESKARLNLSDVGSLKFGSSVSIWQVPAEPPHTPDTTDGGPGWLLGSGLNGGLPRPLLVYCLAPTTPLLTYGLDSHTVGGMLWK